VEGTRVETVLWGVLVVDLSVALALAGFVVVRRFVPMELRDTHNDNTAVIFGALYVMYGVSWSASPRTLPPTTTTTRREPPRLRPAAYRSYTAWRRVFPMGNGRRRRS
jgi:hypothetical protein